MISLAPTTAFSLAQEVRQLPGAVVERFRRFDRLWSPGDEALHLFIVEEGLIRTVGGAPESRQVLLALVKPGELLGEQVLFSEAPHTTTAQVIHESLVWRVPKGSVLEYCTYHTEAWRWIAGQAIARQRQTERRLELLATHEVEERLLIQLAEMAEEAEHQLIKLSQEDLAAIVGATRETTSTLLNGFARRGLVRLGRCSIKVLSVAALRNALAEPR